MFDKIKDLLGGGGAKDLGDLPLGGIEKYLEGVQYPIGLDDLMMVLKNNGAPDQIQKTVQQFAGSGKSSFSSQDDLVASLKSQAKNVL